MQQQMRWPSGFVKSLAGLITPAICVMVMSPSSFHPWIAKNQMSMCLDCPVGLSALMISMADLLSLHIGVGASMARPSLSSVEHMCFTSFAAVTAAIGLPLVEAEYKKNFWMINSKNLNLSLSKKSSSTLQAFKR